MLAERFGWTLKEVDSLSLGDLEEWFQIQDARVKANAPEPTPDVKPVLQRR